MVRFAELQISNKEWKDTGDGKEEVDVLQFKGFFLEACLPISETGATFMIHDNFTQDKIMKLKDIKFRRGKMSKEEQMKHNYNVVMENSMQLKWIPYNEHLQEITKINDPIINNRYTVYTTNEEIARSLVRDEALIAYLKKYYYKEDYWPDIEVKGFFQQMDKNEIGRIKEHYFCISIIGDKLYALFPLYRESLLEPDWNKRFTNYKNIRPYFEDLELVFEFIYALEKMDLINNNS